MEFILSVNFTNRKAIYDVRNTNPIKLSFVLELNNRFNIFIIIYAREQGNNSISSTSIKAYNSSEFTVKLT